MGSFVSSPPGLRAGTPLVMDPYASNVSVSQAHGLGAVPLMINCELECKTAEDGWAVGDKILFQAHFMNGTYTVGLTIWWDATNVYFLTSTPQLAYQNKGTRANATFTPANFKATLTPYA